MVLSPIIGPVEVVPVEHDYPRLEASTIPSIPELQVMAEDIAQEYGIPARTLSNLIDSESRWDIWAPGDKGDACGLVQINRRFFPEEHKRCYDWEFSMRFAAQKIAEGKEWLWTPCSCVSTVRLKVPDLPKGNADTFVPNTDMQNGEVLILNYGGKIHLAEKDEIVNEGIWVFEGNFEPCLIKIRLITWQELNKTLVGFYSP